MKQQLLNTFLVMGFGIMSLVACGGSDDSAGTTQDTPPSPSVSTIAVTSGTNFRSSPVRLSFSSTNFTIGAPDTPHMRFSVDRGPSNDFYVGTGDDSELGVQFKGAHTHFAHWASRDSFDLFGLAAGSHSIRLTLVDEFDKELPNSGATTVHNFTVQQPPPGNLTLQSVMSRLNFPVSLSQAPDGRIFFNERLTGNIRVINSNWRLDPVNFCSVFVQTAVEQGLLGLTLDPNFNLNQTLYIYYTAQGLSNRVSKLVKQPNGSCIETVILPNLPTHGFHIGGIIAFGPADGKLYVVIGDVGVPSNAQNPDSLAGKILRVNTDGSPAPGNPFASSADAQKVYSLGHRNSFGLTFHPSTGHLWESENGPNDSDEVNRIVPGGNYGWPIVRGITNNPNFRNPIVAFTPVIAPTGIVGIPSDSPVYPSPFRGSLLVAAFIDGSIRVVTPNETDPDLPGTASVAYPGGAGGLLSLLRASDGYVYASTADSIFRVVPSH